MSKNQPPRSIRKGDMKIFPLFDLEKALFLPGWNSLYAEFVGNMGVNFAGFNFSDWLLIFVSFSYYSSLFVRSSHNSTPSWSKGELKFGIQISYASQMCFLEISTFQSHCSPLQFPNRLFFLQGFSYFLIFCHAYVSSNWSIRFKFGM